MEKRTFKQQLQESKERHNIKDEYVELKEPISFVDELPKDRETAVIDLATLQRLAHNLAGAEINTIVSNFINALHSNTYKSINDYTKLLDDESAFHKTVDSIVKYNNKK